MPIAEKLLTALTDSAGVTNAFVFQYSLFLLSQTSYQSNHAIFCHVFPHVIQHLVKWNFTVLCISSAMSIIIHSKRN